MNLPELFIVSDCSFETGKPDEANVVGSVKTSPASPWRFWRPRASSVPGAGCTPPRPMRKASALCALGWWRRCRWSLKHNESTMRKNARKEGFFSGRF